MQKINMCSVGQKKKKKRKKAPHFSWQFVTENNKNGKSIGNYVFAQFIKKKKKLRKLLSY